MNYRNYEHDIMKNNGVKLVGWPGGIQMTKPGLIGAVTDLREIWSAIERKELHFEQLTPDEIAALKSSSVQTSSDPNDPAVPSSRKRKARSDKGVSRGPRKKGGGNTGDAPHRSKKRKQMEAPEPGPSTGEGSGTQVRDDDTSDEQD
jgi:hypothetical protein